MNCLIPRPDGSEVLVQVEGQFVPTTNKTLCVFRSHNRPGYSLTHAPTGRSIAGGAKGDTKTACIAVGREWYHSLSDIAKDALTSDSAADVRKAVTAKEYASLRTLIFRHLT